MKLTSHVHQYTTEVKLRTDTFPVRFRHSWVLNETKGKITYTQYTATVRVCVAETHCTSVQLSSSSNLLRHLQSSLRFRGFHQYLQANSGFGLPPY